MFAPGVESLAIEFELTKRTLATLSVTLYLLGFALGPMIISPLSELFGRLPVYHVANLVFVTFVIGNALSKDIAQFMVFRFFSGFAGATPLTIGGSTIADVFPPKERGLAACRSINSVIATRAITVPFLYAIQQLCSVSAP